MVVDACSIVAAVEDSNTHQLMVEDNIVVVDYNIAVVQEGGIVVVAALQELHLLDMFVVLEPDLQLVLWKKMVVVVLHLASHLLMV
mmetsp:Transcript_1376/g.2125  ORF Transcript_1376/g.2125 Transcript_1376/m.2125 type:complete len:86 (+) Transcript_1376:170-427(+)